MSLPEHAKSGPGEFSHPAPPPPYVVNPPPPPHPGVSSVTSVVVVGNTLLLGSGPTNIQCPSCHATVQTRVQYESSTRTHLMALLLCLIGCWPCAAIPYCTDSCQNAAHYCPSCGAYLGVYAS